MTQRTFVAIDLPPQLHTALETFQAHAKIALREHLEVFKTAVPPVARGQLLDDLMRWTRPGAAHLTLRFLGDTSPEQVDALRQTLAARLARFPPFSLRLGGVGCFPNAHRPGSFWLGLVDVPPELRELQLGVETCARELGFGPEPRPFRPHLTVARSTRKAQVPLLRSLGQGWLALSSYTRAVGAPFTVREVIHFQSQLPGPGGGAAVYTPLAHLPLGGQRAIQDNE